MSTLAGTSNVVGGGLPICQGGDEAAKGHVDEKKDGNSLSHFETDSGHSQGPDKASSESNGFDHNEESLIDVDSLYDRKFESLDELYEALEAAGLADSKFKLDNNGFAVKPDARHSRGTRYLGRKLDRWNRGWSNGWFGTWGCASNDNAMQVQGLMTPAGRPQKREPDVAFWGYPRCVKIGGEYEAKWQPGGVKFEVDPDVVFQFSDANLFDTENLDLMMNAGVGQVTDAKPRVGFLLKLWEDAGVVGIDIYKVPRGATVQDAEDNQNGATHKKYTHGKGDVSIAICPKDMGIEGIWSLLCPSFKLSTKELWVRLNPE